MRGRFVLLAASVAIASASGACAPGFVTRTPGVTLVPSRLAVGPAVVTVVEFDGNGNLAPRPDWAADAAQNVDAAVAARVTANGGRIFVAADVAHTDVAYGDFRRWSSGALQEIAGKLHGSRPSANRSVAEWRYPQSLATWHAALAADFVLAVLFVDAYEPADKAAPAAAGATEPDAARYRAAQTGIVCAVDLGDGRIVWCETAREAFGDLRTPEAARRAVGAIVAELCPKGDLPLASGRHGGMKYWHAPAAVPTTVPPLVKDASMSRMTFEVRPTSPIPMRDRHADSGTAARSTRVAPSRTVVEPPAVVTANAVPALGCADQTANQLASGSSNVTCIAGEPVSDGVTVAGSTVNAMRTSTVEWVMLSSGISQLQGCWIQPAAVFV